MFRFLLLFVASLGVLCISVALLFPLPRLKDAQRYLQFCSNYDKNYSINNWRNLIEQIKSLAYIERTVAGERNENTPCPSNLTSAEYFTPLITRCMSIAEKIICLQATNKSKSIHLSGSISPPEQTNTIPTKNSSYISYHIIQRKSKRKHKKIKWFLVSFKWKKHTTRTSI